MKKYTGYEIWKAIHYTNPEKLEDKFGFNSQTEFIIAEELNSEKEAYDDAEREKYEELMRNR